MRAAPGWDCTLSGLHKATVPNMMKAIIDVACKCWQCALPDMPRVWLTLGSEACLRLGFRQRLLGTHAFMFDTVE